MRYDWQLGPADVYSDEVFTDAISQIHWWCVLYADDGTTYKKNDTVQLGAPNLETFVPFDSVTEEMVEAWVYGVINVEQIHSELEAEHASAVQPVKTFNF